MSAKTATVVSLSSEIGLLKLAVDAARQLLEHATESRQDARALAQPEALLSLASCRLGLLKAVVQEQLDPRVLLAKHNESAAGIESDDPDIQLRPWSPAERARRFETEIEQITKQLTHDRRRA